MNHMTAIRCRFIKHEIEIHKCFKDISHKCTKLSEFCNTSMAEQRVALVIIQSFRKRKESNANLNERRSLVKRVRPEVRIYG